MANGVHPDDFDVPGQPVQPPPPIVTAPQPSSTVQQQSPPIVASPPPLPQHAQNVPAISSPALPRAANLAWIGLVVAIAIGAFALWKSSTGPKFPPSSVGSTAPAQFLRLEGSIIGSLSPVQTLPDWMRTLFGGRVIPADNYPPPANFQIRDRCAGEGCSYQRQWRALKEVPLFAVWDQPNPAQVYTLSNRETATALGGVWITLIPAVFEVQRPISIGGIGLQSGDLVYGFMYLGEGFMRGFFHGRIGDFSLEGPNNQAVLRKLREYESVLWVQMRTGSGVTGWTKEGAYPSFDGQSESSGGAPYLFVHEGQEQGGLWDFDIEASSQGRPASIKIGEQSLPLANPNQLERIHTGFVFKPGEMQAVDLVDENGELLAKTFVQPTKPVDTNPVDVPVPPQTVVKPSYDCSRATTPTELLICRDGSLATLEAQMVAVHDRLLSRLSAVDASDFRAEHLQWFKDWSGTCNTIGATQTETELRACVTQFLTKRIEQLRQRVPDEDR